MVLYYLIPNVQWWRIPHHLCRGYAATTHDGRSPLRGSMPFDRCDQVDMTTRTPGHLRFSMPAEWEPHEATWLGWPQNASDWPGKMGAIRWVYGEIVRKIAPGEKVRILVGSEAVEARARRVLKTAAVDLGQVAFFHWPTDRGWMRDSGPIFVYRQRNGRAETAIVDFHFNAWARYDNWREDRKVAGRAARALGLPLFDATCKGRPFVLEGGGVDVNGRGTLLTTEECYLDSQTQVRNPGLGRRDYEEAFRRYLGAGNVLWLGGGVTGDDTHGHVDDICRFVNPTTVVCCRSNDPKDVNYRPLAENFERLSGMRLEDGSKIEVVPLPMPGPLNWRKLRLPASYANFYVANAAVLVPTFNDPADRRALGILAELFPDRPVVGIHAVDLVLGFGTLHCLTQQQPAGLTDQPDFLRRTL
jgi:agmatine deiminase